ncbi:MAG: type III-B CRISPR-associated protein Cas10/Cmr2 [Acidobacteria bacterium]|nr:type III-B CRISPR-associated protein Cas10/Cmr2 [Acidobacteriota bacterium]
MKSSLLAFHLGPIQDFISTARRTQDLWIGSWLLSHLSRTAIKTAQGNQAILILPKPKMSSKFGDPTEADTPNHFLVEFESDEPSKVAENIEAAVRSEWKRIATQVKTEFFKEVTDGLWDRQINTFLEIYWVILTGPDLSRNDALAALDARKRLRDFQPTEEPHIKCTLCGTRQELSGKSSVYDARKWWFEKINQDPGRLRLREDGSERLCAVCVVKRTALVAKAVNLDKQDGSFPSTSGVAAAPFKAKLLKEGEAEPLLKLHFQALEDVFLPAQVDEECLPELVRIHTGFSQAIRRKLLTYDGDVFYPEQFVEEKFKKEFPKSFNDLTALTQQKADELTFSKDDLMEYEQSYDDEELFKEEVYTLQARLRKVHIQLRNLVKKLEVSPSKYFAALMMDGDHMGAFFGNASTEQAQELSECVSTFAREKSKTIVEEHFGRLVYAGGDDVLALLPLETVLPCARKLQEEFKSSIKDISLPEGVAHYPTPSAGVVIAHHLSPLDRVLSSLRGAEKTAKNRYGRDALCVYLLKRSGEEIQVGTHWKYDNPGPVDAVAIMAQVIKALRDETLSMKFPYAVSEEVRGLCATTLPAEARGAALKRLAKRHSEQGDENKTKAKEIATLLAAWCEGKNPDDSRSLGFEEISRWILVARFIAAGGRDER